MQQITRHASDARLAMSRRQFAQAMGLAAALAAFGGSLGVISREAAAAEAASTTSCDVLVVGAGGAGAAAASQAAANGAKTIVIEKGASQMGSSVLALGTFYGAGTQLQKAAGIQDDPSGLLDYFMSRGGDKLDPEVQKFCAENFGKTIDWLVEDLKVPFKDKVSLKGTDTVPRGHNCANTANDALQAVTSLAESYGAQFVFSTAAKSLIVDKGAVVGVLATDADGKDVQYDAKKTIMACGGFARNPEMIDKYMPDYSGVYTEVGAGCTGEGLQMGLDVGAGYIGHGGVNGILFCAVQTGQSKLISKNALWLTSEGKRFVNEDGQTHEIFNQVAAFPDKSFYAIYDQAMVDALDDKLKEKFQKGLDMGIFAQGDTVADAADALGLPGEAFDAALADYNALCDAGQDTEFGKAADCLVPLTEAPFYVLTMGVCTHGTFGGYDVNANLEVLDANGKVIPNFYAVGECSCGTFIYDDYPAGGCGLNWAYTSGRFAGMNAAVAIKGGTGVANAKGAADGETKPAAASSAKDAKTAASSSAKDASKAASAASEKGDKAASAGTAGASTSADAKAATESKDGEKAAAGASAKSDK